MLTKSPHTDLFKIQEQIYLYLPDYKESDDVESHLFKQDGFVITCWGIPYLNYVYRYLPSAIEATKTLIEEDKEEPGEYNNYTIRGFKFND